MIPYPNISPTIISIGPLHIRWYGFMYVVGFALGFFFMHRLGVRKNSAFRGDKILDFLTYAAIGLIVGGRLGYVLFYNFAYYSEHPLEAFALWHGGLSFHGGVIGVLLTGWYYTKRNNFSFYEVADIVVVPLPLGILCGRLGNFINGELFGRATDVPWCMVFPNGGPVCRHPSQLYEAGLEGLLMFASLWWLSRKVRAPGVLFWSFFILYGVCRFIVEFFREPDPQLGLILGPFSMGQLLSLPMVIVGIWMVYRRSRSGV